MLDLVINKKEDVENILLIENGRILESYTCTEEDKKRRLEGNIYVGEVADIIKGMQAAFIDFGGDKKGFIHLKDSIPQVDETKEEVDTSIDIKDVLKPKQKVLVQVKKDSDAIKGARVSTHISLPGKYIVLMPNADFFTISQKIVDEAKKKELIDFVKDNLPEKFGAIVRTSSANAKKEEIKKDIKNLLEKWNTVKEKFDKSNNGPELLLESENISEKIITDLSDKGLEKVVTNDEAEFKKINKLIPSESKIQVLLEKDEDLFSKYDLTKQLEKVQNRKIWLNCGGFITIDKTEALTAIDVNTGKFTGSRDLETTVYKVNKEATIEIAKQLRLRDIGGIIIIDYIDMHKDENKQKIVELLKDELKNDRAKTQVEGFTKLNLMELTRKHICSHLN